MTRTIYHICRAEEWQAAQAAGEHAGSSQDTGLDAAGGFIHFSTAAQVRLSAAKHRSGQDGLVLVAADPALLGPALKWEPSRGGRLFPHLYGPLPLSAVKYATELPLDAAGAHVFPVLED